MTNRFAQIILLAITPLLVAAYCGLARQAALPLSRDVTPTTEPTPVRLAQYALLTPKATSPTASDLTLATVAPRSAIRPSAAGLAITPTGPPPNGQGEGSITGLTAANDSPTLLGERTVFTAGVRSGGDVTYRWDFGDGQGAGRGANPSYIYPRPGVYTAEVTALNPVSLVTATVVATITTERATPGSASTPPLGAAAATGLPPTTGATPAALPPPDATSAALPDDDDDDADPTRVHGGKPSDPSTLPEMSFVRAVYTVKENAGQILLTVQLDKPSDTPVTADYFSSDGLLAGTITFAPDQTSIQIPVAIQDDITANEAVETLLVILVNVSQNAQLDSTGRRSTQVHIEDDDGRPVVGFSGPSFSVIEGDGRVEIEVSLDKPSAKPVEVAYRMTDSTAQSPDDYAATGGVLIFPPGLIGHRFEIIIKDDVNYEPDETVSLHLSEAKNANIGQAGAALTILDDDSRLSFSLPAYDAGSGADLVPITVILDPPASVTAMVAYATSDGTAQAPLDYIATSGVLTFTPGQTSAVFTVTVTGVSDIIVRSGKMINLVLSNPTNARLSPPDMATISIPDCTLAEAITAANTDTVTGDCPAGSGDDIIEVRITGAIALTVSLPAIASNMTINGPGADSLTIRRDSDSGGDYRIFEIMTGSTAAISGTTVSNGVAIGFFPDGRGGGVFNQGLLTLTDVKVVSNTASNGGGGIYNDSGGTIMLTASTVAGNTAAVGGGIDNSGTMTLTNSTVAGNIADQDQGGGIDNSGMMTLTNSTVSGNTVLMTFGGGIYNFGTMTLMASTVSGNTAPTGGGIDNDGFNSGTMTLTASTVSGNTATDSGGINASFNSTTVLSDTIVANNVSGGDCGGGGTITSTGYNLSGDTSCDAYLVATGDITNTDPVLGPLQNNGGPTKTHALLPGSPVIDAGSCPGSTTDQRGLPRPVNQPAVNVDDGCDIGAFEVQ